MNLRKKSKQAILSSLIALTLSSSIAFAMPAGGNVVAGNVSVTDGGNLAQMVSGGTLNVTGSSLIDWKSFSIGQGETLNVIFHGMGQNMLVNHVTGGDISQLLGTLNAKQGEGGFMLINPNGIVVGKDAQLNVGSLILSTLDISMDADQFKKVSDAGFNNFYPEYKNTKNGVLDIRGGHINVEDTLKLYGAKVQIADGVTISNGLQLLQENGKDIVHESSKNVVNEADIYAADWLKENELKGNELKATKDNTITMGKAVFSNDGKVFNQYIIGGAVTLNGTQIGTEAKPLNDFEVKALGEVSLTNSTWTFAAGAGNSITFNNVAVNVAPVTYDAPWGTSVSPGNMALYGGKIAINNSQLTANNGRTVIGAFHKGYWGHRGLKADDVTFNNVVSIKKSTLTNSLSEKIEANMNRNDKGRLLISGAVIDVTDSQIKAADRAEVYAAYMTKEANTFQSPDGAKITLRDTTVSGGDVALVANKVSLQGNTKIELDKDRFWVAAAGNNIKLGSGDSKFDKDTYTKVESMDGKISISQATYDSLQKSGVMKFIKDYVIVEEAPVVEAADNTELAADIERIYQDSSLTEQEKLEKTKEVFRQDETANAIMESVRSHVDSAHTTAPQTTAVLVVKNIDATNVTAGEGVTSSDKNAVTGVEEQ